MLIILFIVVNKQYLNIVYGMDNITIYEIAKSFGDNKYKYLKYNSKYGSRCESDRNWGQSGFLKKKHQHSQHAKRDSNRSILVKIPFTDLCASDITKVKKDNYY